MKPFLILLLTCFAQLVFAQQKQAGKILVDTTNYRIEQIDGNQYQGYLNSSSHHSGVDTLDNKTIVKIFSPYSDDILYVESKNNQQGIMNSLSLYHADSSSSIEKLTYPIPIPLANYNIEFVHWLFAKSVVVKLKSVKSGPYQYLLILFKNI